MLTLPTLYVTQVMAARIWLRKPNASHVVIMALHATRVCLALQTLLRTVVQVGTRTLVLSIATLNSIAYTHRGKGSSVSLLAYLSSLASIQTNHVYNGSRYPDPCRIYTVCGEGVTLLENCMQHNCTVETSDGLAIASCDICSPGYRRVKASGSKVYICQACTSSCSAGNYLTNPCTGLTTKDTAKCTGMDDITIAGHPKVSNK